MCSSDLENQKLVGKTLRVLVDGKSDDESYPLSARTEGHQLVLLRGDESKIGSWAEVTIERCSTWSLFANV